MIKIQIANSTEPDDIVVWRRCCPVWQTETNRIPTMGTNILHWKKINGVHCNLQEMAVLLKKIFFPISVRFSVGFCVCVLFPTVNPRVHFFLSQPYIRTAFIDLVCILYPTLLSFYYTLCYLYKTVRIYCERKKKSEFTKQKIDRQERDTGSE